MFFRNFLFNPVYRIGLDIPFIKYVILPKNMNFTTLMLVLIPGIVATMKDTHGGIHVRINIEQTRNAILVVRRLTSLDSCSCLTCATADVPVGTLSTWVFIVFRTCSDTPPDTDGIGYACADCSLIRFGTGKFSLCGT